MIRTVPRQGLDKALLYNLAQADGRRTAVRTLGILAVYAGGVALALQASVGWWSVVLSMFLGFVISGFIQAAHDCVHRSHMRSKTGNRIAGAAWSTPTLVNFTIFRCQHLVHHRLTGVAGDTEPPDSFITVRAYLHTLSGIPSWPGTLSRIRKTWQGQFPASVSTEERRRGARQDNVAICAWLVLAIGLTVYFPHALLIAYWLPLVFFFFFTVLLSLPEHYGLWGVPEVERNTRTVRSNAVVRYFIWNANYHAEHHRFPAVTSLNLHRLHEAMPQPHPIQQKSYLGFHLDLGKGLLEGQRQTRREVTSAQANIRQFDQSRDGGPLG